jgi:glycosyltransferase involved in cell wall biosynthesis
MKGDKAMVVLSMITYNSYSKMNSSIGLERVLDSTLQIPYRQMILVDDSHDETSNLVKAWCERNEKELLSLRSRLYGYHRHTRATARQTAIDVLLESFDDEWLMFVDDDVVLKDGWWGWVLENKVLEDHGVGEVWGINWDATPERKKFLAALGIDLKSYLIRKFSERGGTHDTLYRRRAIEGVKISPELHVYEDAYLHFYVTCNGWKSIINPVGVLHYHPVSVYTDLKYEKEKAKVAIEVALKYGICEYENTRTIKESIKSKVLSYAGLLRPIFGFFVMLPTAVKVYGFKIGLTEAVKRQYLKLWFRWQVLNSVNKTVRIPPICEVIRRDRGRMNERSNK